jgi:hypothetical protein
LTRTSTRPRDATHQSDASDQTILAPALHLQNSMLIGRRS